MPLEHVDHLEVQAVPVPAVGLGHGPDDPDDVGPDLAAGGLLDAEISLDEIVAQAVALETGLARPVDRDPGSALAHVLCPPSGSEA